MFKGLTFKGDRPTCSIHFSFEIEKTSRVRGKYNFTRSAPESLFVCLFVCFCGRPLSKELGIPIGILPTSGAGVDGNAPYQVNPGIQTNFLPPRPVQS